MTLIEKIHRLRKKARLDKELNELQSIQTEKNGPRLSHTIKYSGAYRKPGLQVQIGADIHPISAIR